MATVYSTIYDTATDPAAPLRKQVVVAIRKAAFDILNEDPATANHPYRLDFANRMLNDPNAAIAVAASWVWNVLDNATIQAAPTLAVDSDVQFVVNGLVNSFIKA